MSYELEIVCASMDSRKCKIIADEVGWRVQGAELLASAPDKQSADTLMNHCLFSLRMAGVQILESRVKNSA